MTRKHTRKNKNTKNKTKKHARNFHYLIVSKYTKNILGQNIDFFVLNIKEKNVCTYKLKSINKLSIKFRESMHKIINLKNNYLLKNKIFTKRIKIDSNITKKLIDVLDINSTYNYCLSDNKLILAETYKHTNTNPVRDSLTKHITICNNNVPCAVGEMNLTKSHLIFNNNSGSYKPTPVTLQQIRNAFPFLFIKLKKFNPDNIQ